MGHSLLRHHVQNEILFKRNIRKNELLGFLKTGKVNKQQ